MKTAFFTMKDMKLMKKGMLTTNHTKNTKVIQKIKK